MVSTKKCSTNKIEIMRNHTGYRKMVPLCTDIYMVTTITQL